MNAACDACTCDHHVLTGRALTVDDAPLSEANISLAETPYRILAQTNISGHFTAPGVCAIQQELLVTKEGFVPVTQKANIVTSTAAILIAKLQIAGILHRLIVVFCFPPSTLSFELSSCLFIIVY